MKRVLVVRKFDDFSRILSENGISVINCPTIRTVVREDLKDFSVKLETIDNYDGIFLTSSMATNIFLQKFRENKLKFRGKFYVLGKRSFDLLKSENLNLVFDETANTAREMLEKIKTDDLKNKRFLFIRGEKSLRVVPDFLSEIATIEETIVYRTEKAPVVIDKINAIAQLIKKNEISCAVFFSPSGAESFSEQFGADNLHQIKIATIGKTTADFFEKRNLKVDFIASKTMVKDFAIEFIEYLKYFEQKFTIYQSL
jgi:uroporphyrinogen-III synthase